MFMRIATIVFASANAAVIRKRTGRCSNIEHYLAPVLHKRLLTKTSANIASQRIGLSVLCDWILPAHLGTTAFSRTLRVWLERPDALSNVLCKIVAFNRQDSDSMLGYAMSFRCLSMRTIWEAGLDQSIPFPRGRILANLLLQVPLAAPDRLLRDHMFTRYSSHAFPN